MEAGIGQTRIRDVTWLPLFQYLQGLDEEQEPSVWFKQRSIGQEEEGQGRSRGRGQGLQVRWQCHCSWWF